MVYSAIHPHSVNGVRRRTRRRRRRGIPLSRAGQKKNYCTHRNDVTTQSMCCVSTFHDRAELRVAHSRLLACGAHWTRSYANLDDVSTTQYQLLNHLTCHYITSLGWHSGGVGGGVCVCVLESQYTRVHEREREREREREIEGKRWYLTMIVWSRKSFLACLTRLTKCSEYPLATSRQMYFTAGTLITISLSLA